jgi:uncharacterized repeat protein (TIGR04076 family)
MAKCKVTVLKTSLNKELAEEYIQEERKKTIGPCEVFKEGQEFIVDPFGGLPSGFCPWAWDDIYKGLFAFAAEGNFGRWFKSENVLISCCSDGIRPVYFKIEKIAE